MKPAGCRVKKKFTNTEPTSLQHTKTTRSQAQTGSGRSQLQTGENNYSDYTRHQAGKTRSKFTRDQFVLIIGSEFLSLLIRPETLVTFQQTAAEVRQTGGIRQEVWWMTSAH